MRFVQDLQVITVCLVEYALFPTEKVADRCIRSCALPNVHVTKVGWLKIISKPTLSLFLLALTSLHMQFYSSVIECPS